MHIHMTHFTERGVIILYILKFCIANMLTFLIQVQSKISARNEIILNVEMEKNLINIIF